MDNYKMPYIDVEVKLRIRVPFNGAIDEVTAIADLIVTNSDTKDEIIIRRTNFDAENGMPHTWPNGAEKMEYMQPLYSSREPVDIGSSVTPTKVTIINRGEHEYNPEDVSGGVDVESEVVKYE